MDGFPVTIKEAVGKLNGFLAAQTFGLVMNCALYVGGKFPHDHLFDDVVNRNVSDFLFDEGIHFRWKSSISLDAVEDYGRALPFCFAVAVFQVLIEGVPLVGCGQ